MFVASIVAGLQIFVLECHSPKSVRRHAERINKTSKSVELGPGKQITCNAGLATDSYRSIVC